MNPTHPTDDTPTARPAMTMPAACTTDSSSTAQRARPFRVYDHTRVLALVTTVLLLSGFGVLRLLTGAADTPRLETTTVEKPITSVIEPAADEVHRMRPQTSGVLPIPASEAPASGEQWNQDLPLSNWQLMPPTGERRDFDLAREPSLFR
ncbi:hypothetical protein NG895_11955 [Aeoliella sp. ICT_H6.2]|uniref:Uncharacterized protein n=1 Tax=Aeoliella straminimaris TaxID=2954799 RepID=A0A9X2JGP5_9BACT|nr:hypothetical protein [Aeoliella straminimaris]MCO6044622.1 hypothetical protein [Aeoliella straminimaris]